jgi:hypothetical protein
LRRFELALLLGLGLLGEARLLVALGVDAISSSGWPKQAGGTVWP